MPPALSCTFLTIELNGNEENATLEQDATLGGYGSMGVFCPLFRRGQQPQQQPTLRYLSGRSGGQGWQDREGREFMGPA